MPDALLGLSAYELAKKVEAREVSAREAAEAANARVEEVEGDVNSFVTTTPELAIKRAERVDARMKDGGVKLWEGVPIAVKDVLSTRGVRTTCGSKILENFEPLYDASALLNYGEDMIVVGKANCDEFAMGSSTENSAYGPTRNPWSLNRVPGGSSGGSAAAVAAGEGWWSLGTDTGGSVRQPAALCGIVGLKPTYGRVSRYGLIAFASSLDQIGPMTRDVRDSALLLQAIAGHDPRDSTSANVEVPDYLAELEGGVAGLRIGVVKELTDERIEVPVREVIDRVAQGLEAAGAEVGEASLPHSRYALPAYYIMLGTYALSSGYYDAYYAQAQKVRTRIIEDYRNAFHRYDVLISPTSPTVAFEIGARIDDPLAMYLSDICAVPVNLAGIPAINVPGGLSEGLPVGVQLMSDHFTEPMLLRAARAVEEVADFRFELKP